MATLVTAHTSVPQSERTSSPLPPPKKKSRRGRGSREKAKRRFIDRRNLMLSNLFNHYRVLQRSSDTRYEAFERFLHIKNTFGKCEMGLTPDELLVMRYGHLVVTTNTTFSFSDITTLECLSNKQPPPLDKDDAGIEIDSLDDLDDYQWRLRQRAACSCVLPEYWFSPLSCGNHSLRDSRYYYQNSDIIALGYVYLPYLDVTCESSDDGYSSFHSDPEDPDVLDVSSACVNVLSCGVTSIDEHLWYSSLAVRDKREVNWKSWQKQKSARCLEVLNIKVGSWRREEAPFVALEVGPATVFWAKQTTLPSCIQPGTMRQSEFRMFTDLEKFKQAGGSKLIICSPDNKVELDGCLTLVVDCPIMFTIHGHPIVRATKKTVQWTF